MTPNVDTLAALPKTEDHPRLRAATATVNRLAGEVARLERELSDHQLLAAESLAAAQDIPRRLVGGATLGEVRQTPNDRVFERITGDLQNARRGLELAAKERDQAEHEAARELADQFAPEFRRRMQAAALSYISHAREMHAFRAFIDDVRDHGILTGPCGNVLPLFADDDPFSIDGRFPQVMRDLIDAGILDERADADLLRGLAVAPKYVPPPPPAPPAPKNPLSYGQIVRQLVGL